MSIFISDLDGTIADISHRLPLIQQAKPQWREFFRACSRDSPIRDVIALLRAIKDSGHELVYITGRSDEVRAETETWLFLSNIESRISPGLYMRKEGDYRPDFTVKGELLDQLLHKHPQYRIAGVFEDKAPAVEMYRKRGLRVYQVAESSY